MLLAARGMNCPVSCAGARPRAGNIARRRARLARALRQPAPGRAERLPVDLSGLTNLHRMANTPDPRDFYRVSRAVLVPSLWRESLGRVPIEAMANGIPALASDRGACPRRLATLDSCSRFPNATRPNRWRSPRPARSRHGSPCSSGSGTTRNSKSRHRDLARAEAMRWQPEHIADQFERLFKSLGRDRDNNAVTQI